MLSGYEDVPGAEAWRALGPETLQVLVSLYNDGSEPPYVRLRAVGAAAHYPSPAARTFLLGVARAPGQNDLFVRAAVLALGRAFDQRAVDAVKSFLGHRDAVVREAAARALGRMGGPEATRALRARMDEETDPQVRSALDRALNSPGRTR
jgi:HEAT repeat protein